MGFLKFQNFYYKVLQLDIIKKNRYADKKKIKHAKLGNAMLDN